ncbi:MAG TPA: N-acetyltransferase [Terriglobales bacterium]
MKARKALLPDLQAIHELISSYVPDGTLLPRSEKEICENICDFTVVEDDGEIIACGALHFYGIHLTEVRSIAVSPKAQGKGAGRVLIQALLKEANMHSVQAICLFTRVPGFFAKLGFREVNKDDLPDKALKDCHKCPKLHCCDEVAMLIGEIPPKTVDLPAAAGDLVQLQVSC